ncbi:MAG: hypothetical protein ACXAD7_11940 [Candidatus Kariarchaeaceae archaeon]
MRLEDMAFRAIEVLKKIGTEGINNAELATTLDVPKRRVYDVVAILKAAGLITTTRDKNGTRLYWHGGTTEEKPLSGNRIRSNKIRVSTTGFITSVSNRGTEVIIESTSPSMSIEGI